MEFNIGNYTIYLSDVSGLSIFWVCAVVISFNGAYLLYLSDQKHLGNDKISSARVKMTMFVGTLVMVATYADTLAEKPFVLKDCFLLALIAAHGWMAEHLLNTMLSKANEREKALVAPLNDTSNDGSR